MRYTLAAWIKLLRPHQYTKNALIFVPALFAKAWPSLPVVGVGFLLWSVGASALYMVNDAYDAPLDRHHPQKNFVLLPLALSRLRKPTSRSLPRSGHTGGKLSSEPPLGCADSLVWPEYAPIYLLAEKPPALGHF